VNKKKKVSKLLVLAAHPKWTLTRVPILQCQHISPADRLCFPVARCSLLTSCACIKNMQSRHVGQVSCMQRGGSLDAPSRRRGSFAGISKARRCFLAFLWKHAGMILGAYNWATSWCVAVGVFPTSSSIAAVASNAVRSLESSC
jgi:hypothetical protein